MKFVLDENVPIGIIHLIRANNRKHDAHRIVDDLGLGVLDTVWIPHYAKQNPRPYIIGADRLKKTTLEVQALKGSGLIYIRMDGWCSVKWSLVQWQFLRGWPNVVDALEKLNGQPHLVRYKRDESIELFPL